MYIILFHKHRSGVIMSTMASQIISLTLVCWSVCLGEDRRKHQSSASLAFMMGIHRWPVNSPHKRPVTRKMFPFKDVIMRDPSHPSPSVNVFFLTSLDAASISGYPSTRVVWNSSCEQLSLKIGYVIRFARKIHSLFYSYLSIRAMVTFIMIWSIFLLYYRNYNAYLMVSSWFLYLYLIGTKPLSEPMLEYCQFET